MYTDIFFCSFMKGPGCGALLVRSINRTIKGTNHVGGDFDGHNAVLNSSNAWCSSVPNKQQNLTVTLGKKYFIHFKMNRWNSIHVSKAQFRRRTLHEPNRIGILADPN